MASLESVRSFDEAFNKWKTEIDVKRALRQEYGSLSLMDLEPTFARFQQQLADTDQIKVDIPTEVMEKISNQLRDIFATCKQLMSLSEGDYSNARTGLRNSLVKLFDVFHMLWLSVVPIIQQLKTGSPQDFIKMGEAEIKRLQELRVTQEKEMQELKERFKEVFDVPTLAGEKNRFDTTAAVCIDRARWWFGGIIVSSLMLAAWLIYIGFNFCFELNCYDIATINRYNATCQSCPENILYFEIIKSILFRLLIVSFLAFLVGLTIRGYNANMHNYTVNKHKANSLDAALYLIGKGSPQSSDLVINQASSAIFSHQPTGFTSKNPENAGIPLIERVLEFLKRQ